MTTTQKPATEKQIAFLEKLMAERQGTEVTQQVQRGLALLSQQPVGVTTREASAFIDALLKAPKAGVAASQPKPKVPEVPAGRYAIDLDGVLAFFRVDRPEDGKWAGYTFVKRQASDDLYPVKGPAARTVLEAIAQDPKGAMIRYGQEIGACGHCGKTLTDEASRAAGIGPTCAKKL